jgi:hypothetical protein
MTITMHGVTSIQIKEIGHDPKTNTLAVRFNHGGTLYHYAGVSAEKFEKFKAAESLGSFLGKHIKGHHDFSKIIEKKEKK